ncbi:2-isopropylmalate synthase [Candidatus Woesearchaeota archaeon]|nr:2-isopropylmalate synthase [Candidatus Woesearchaeota archaeon]
MKKIIIFDTTLRDGEQSPGASLTMKEKLIVAKQLARLGVDVIEAGFPIASKGDFEAVKLIAKSVDGPVICGLARTTYKDIDRAWDAVKYSKKPRIHTFIATSEIHRTKKLRKSKEEIIQMTIDAVKHAKSSCKDIEFSPEDAARTDMDYMCDVVKAAIEAGATTINIPDTVGYAEPEEFGKRIKYVFEKLGDIIKKNNAVISIHCHNDLGLAVANSLEAVRNGALQVECTINGIGERAGNCSLEEVVMNIKTRKDFFKDYYTGIKTTEIFKTSQLVSSLTGLSVQRNKAIVGRNAFAHEAGVHQHGVLSSKLTYEIMKPEEIGWRGTNIVIGKHSGKHAVESILKEMGYDMEKEQIEEVISKVKELADKQKEVMREDIIAIATDIAGGLSKEEEIIKLDEIKVTTGNRIQPEAEVTLIVNGKKKEGKGKGVGPVDAVSNAIAGMMGQSIKLKEYGLKAITGGTDALADVSISVQDKKGNVFKADAVNEDVIMSSAIALIKGINKALNFNAKGGKK